MDYLKILLYFEGAKSGIKKQITTEIDEN